MGVLESHFPSDKNGSYSIHLSFLGDQFWSNSNSPFSPVQVRPHPDVEDYGQDRQSRYMLHPDARCGSRVRTGQGAFAFDLPDTDAEMADGGILDPLARRPSGGLENTELTNEGLEGAY